MSKYTKKILAVVMVVASLSFDIYCDNIIITEHWCFPPPDFDIIIFDSDNIDRQTAIENGFNTNGNPSTYGIYRATCENDFNLLSIIWATIHPEIRDEWHKNKIIELKEMASKSAQRLK